MSDEPRPVFWSISGDELLAMLRRVAAGEDPDFVYMEAYVNSEVTQIEGDEEDDE